MEAERKALQQKLDALDRTLAELPQENAGNGIKTPNTNGTILSPDASVPEVVRAVLRAASAPLSAGDIISRVRELKKGTEPANVHSAISRLRRDGQLDTFGDVGMRTYALQGTFVVSEDQPEEEQAAQ
jgi:hypothetical protein